MTRKLNEELDSALGCRSHQPVEVWVSDTWGYVKKKGCIHTEMPQRQMFESVSVGMCYPYQPVCHQATLCTFKSADCCSRCTQQSCVFPFRSRRLAFRWVLLHSRALLGQEEFYFGWKCWFKDDIRPRKYVSISVFIWLIIVITHFLTILIWGEDLDWTLNACEYTELNTQSCWQATDKPNQAVKAK